jgi:hypothetical protein
MRVRECVWVSENENESESENENESMNIRRDILKREGVVWFIYSCGSLVCDIWYLSVGGRWRGYLSSPIKPNIHLHLSLIQSTNINFILSKLTPFHHLAPSHNVFSNNTQNSLMNIIDSFHIQNSIKINRLLCTLWEKRKEPHVVITYCWVSIL